jgi:hypothetical protein
MKTMKDDGRSMRRKREREKRGKRDPLVLVLAGAFGPMN